MGKKTDAFFDGTPKHMQLGFLGFVIACTGAALAFSIDYGASEPLSFVAFGIVVVGVVTGLISIVWGLVSIVSKGK